MATIHPGWSEGSGNPLPSGTFSAWRFSNTGQTTALGKTTATLNLYESAREEWLISPRMLISASDVLTYEVAITDYNTTSSGVMGSDDFVKVMISNNNGSTWSMVKEFTKTDAISNSLTQQSMSLSAYAGQTIQVAFYGQDGPVEDSNDYDFHLANIFIGTDVTNPTLVSSMPSSGANVAANNISIVLTFSENIAAGTGNIILKAANGSIQTYGINNATATSSPSSDALGILNNKLYINSSAPLTGDIAVQINSTAIEDLSGNSFAGITDETTLTFTVADVTSPTLTSSAPTDDATSISTNSNITLTFNENIAFGTGNIQVNNIDNASKSFTIDIGSSQTLASINGNTLTINPSTNMDDNTNYAIQIATTAIKDLADNNFAGITDSTTLNFTTAPIANTGTHLNFDGSDDEILISNNGNFDFVTGTAEAWVRSSTSSVNRCIMAVRNGTFGASTRWSLHFNEDTNTIVFWNGVDFSSFSVDINPDTWYHVAFVMTDTSYKLYVNGLLITTYTADGINTIPTNIPFVIGNNNDSGNAEAFNGDIDDVRIWNVARTSTEILNNKDVELVGDETGLVAYYKFNQGTAGVNNAGITTLTDNSVNTNNGTLNNFALTDVTSNWGVKVLATVITTTAAASSITTTSATLAGEVTSSGAVTERGIVYSIEATNANPLIGGNGVTKDANGSGTGVFTKSIAGLAAGTQYSFKAYATNSAGTNYGAVTTFTTISSSPTVSTTAADAITTTTVTLAGNATSNGGESITERGIVYAITATNADPLIDGTGVTKDINGTGTGVFTKSITGLTLATQYTFKAYATNSIGTSYGAPSTFTTLPGNYIENGIIIFPKATVPSNYTTENTCHNPSLTINGVTLTTNNGAFEWAGSGLGCKTTFGEDSRHYNPTTFSFSKGVNVASINMRYSNTWTITPNTGDAVTYTGTGEIFLGFKNITSFIVSGLAGSDPYGSVNYVRLADAIWTGATDTDWRRTSNWLSEQLPRSSNGIIIADVANKPIIPIVTDVIVNDIIIDANSSLTVELESFLIINGKLTQNGTLAIKSNATANGSLIAKGTSVGDITYKRYVSSSATSTEGWHIISSPVNGKNISDFYGDVAQNGTKRAIAPYVNTNGANLKWDYYTTANTTDEFIAGKGYIAKRSTAGTLDFVGALNTDNAGVTIELLATGDQNNAIGNPYTSYINSYDFLISLDNDRLTERTLWFWDESANGGAGEYITKNTASEYKIAPGQGFFVKAKTTGNITFTEDLQIHSYFDTFLKQDSNPAIKIAITDGTLIKKTEIFYSADKTTGFDDGYDSSVFSSVSNPFAIYTQLVANNEDKDLAIQTLPDSGYENMIIPIGVTAAIGKEITFSITAENLPNGVNVYLEDRLLNTYTRLDEANANYKVTLVDASNGTGRFYMHTVSKALSTASAILNSVSMYKTTKNTLRIAGLQEGNTAVKIFTILGKQVLTENFAANGIKEILLPKLANGVYIVELQNKTGKLSKKIIIE